ncbi:MAG: c-type cytochrome [Verrucomicrobiales bacterium]|nr:c-type cytochrome [Verrucomicrobiales bacterium]
MRWARRCIGWLGCIGIAGSALAEPALPEVKRLETSPVLRSLKPNPMPVPPRTPAEQTVAQMYLPEGFRAELLVAEPHLHQPIAFAFDHRGRIWIAEAYTYPQKQPAGKGKDRILILEDRDGSGRFATQKVFAEGLNLVSGFELGFGGVWVGAAPELLFIPDRNQDDVPDSPPVVLLDGFGYQDTHECLNSFLWGPDGWLYGNQGVFNFAKIGKPGSTDAERVELRAGVWRYHPVRHEFEVFAHGGSNPWGLDFDERGQIFMTHCRSYFGRGCTTHVIQGGQFWNQANANYAPFIVADPPAQFPDFRNYLLASARYDHGAGGAGAPGSDAIYGGHSHVGTMIYLGDNWPDAYRGHLFTHNLGGHQINHQVNRRLGSGYETVHAGQDQLFCTDPKYVPVDLQYGPDGAVYIIDWYDIQHCHNPNTERWDRSNGRLYRVQYESTFRPVAVNLEAKTDLELVELHRSKNEWQVRHARQLLHERSVARAIERSARNELRRWLEDKSLSESARLKALWSLHAVGDFSAELALACLQDRDEMIRAWTIQLLADRRSLSPSFNQSWLRLAREDGSAAVRLALASAAQRISADLAWEVLEQLALRGEDRSDRNLPALVWHGMAPLMAQDVRRAIQFAQKAALPGIADWIYWYAARSGAEGLPLSLASLGGIPESELGKRLAGLKLALSARGRVSMPPEWKAVAPALYAHTQVSIRRQAEAIAALLGDATAFPRLRDTLSNPASDAESRAHAFNVLSQALDAQAVPVFLQLLDDPSYRSRVLAVLGRFADTSIAPALIQRIPSFNSVDQAAALGTLTRRVSFGSALLDAVAAGRIKRELLTAFHVRSLVSLRDAEIERRVAASWGKFGQTSAEKESKIVQLEKFFNEAPLWAYDTRAGREHFQKLCAACHRLGQEGVRVGPELTGAGRHGVRYFLENIIDPNAVIGTDFQATVVETKQGDVLTGMIVNSSPDSLTLRTSAQEVVVPTGDISRRTTSELSLMPEGLLDSLNDREQVELLKFLTSN